MISKWNHLLSFPSPTPVSCKYRLKFRISIAFTWASCKEKLYLLNFCMLSMKFKGIEVDKERKRKKSYVKSTHFVGKWKPKTGMGNMWAPRYLVTQPVARHTRSYSQATKVRPHIHQIYSKVFGVLFLKWNC